MTYAGNKVFNSNNLVAVTLLLIGIGFLFSKSDNNFAAFILPVTFLITAIEAFYFEVTVDELIIKNYMIPFLNIRYKLNEITQIQFLNPGLRSTAKARVKIIRGDKRSFDFKAASLSIKDWQLFVNELSEKKIPVYIEAYSLKETIGIPED
jgi:hypothetical protein